MLIEEQNKQGVITESKILDLRNVDLAMARMVDGRPVLVVTFLTYQTNIARDQNGVIVEGKENAANRVGYVVALYREADRHPVTGGWKVIEIGTQAA